MNTKRQSHQECRQRWQERLSEQSSSGLSIRSYCEERGIKEHTFKLWERRFRRESAGAGEGIISSSSEGARSESGFIELPRIERSVNATYTIRTASGHELQLGGLFNTERVDQLLQLLGVSKHA